MKVITDEKKIDEVLSRGVENIYPSKEEVKKVFLSGKILSIYNGIDPTGPTLHIGHGSTLLKLRELQDLGHKIILLIGDFTGRIGDPTDKTATRKQLSIKEIKENLKSYTKQAGKILDMKKTQVKFNSKWLSKLSFEEGMEIASEFTLQQMIERDMFEKRIKEGQPIHLHEFFYPLMQGYDSVAMNIDMEIGGNDQTFNMLIGRTMMKNRGKEKYILTTKLLVDPTGKKMGKSEGNMVTLEDSEENMFGKIMSWPDSLIPLAFEICTRVPIPKINEINQNPRDAKMKLAFEIVKIYHGEKKAGEAQESFINTFQKKEIPEEMEEINVLNGELLSEALVKNKILSSKGEWRRLILGNAIHNLDKSKNITDQNLKISENLTLKIGKKRFIKVLIK
ncbi:MAG: tyrosine--tRNA ligase [Candidatus Pacebacteria bacterium]|nr:tyrosine--tRNA ligase [Candidatus Paceibacterota bacterium]